MELIKLSLADAMNNTLRPLIDPNIHHIGVSSLRKMNATTLKSLDGLLVVRHNDDPIVVIVPYKIYLTLQENIQDGS